MNDHAAQQLKQLIIEYGRQLVNEPSRVNALLRDLCPKHEREVHVLSAVAQKGLTKVLLQQGDKISAAILLPRLAQRLYDELGTDQTLAYWAVTAWADALGLKIPDGVQAKASAPPQQTQRPVKHPATARVTSNNALKATAPTPPQQRQRPAKHPATSRVTSTTALIAGRYQVRSNNGDIIYDTTTGLEWQRCSLGQQWNGRTCTGKAKIYTWDEARAAADQVPGWRLPTIDELKTLIYCSSGKPEKFGCECSGDDQSPTIVTEAFPETPSDFFWSASPYAGYSDGAWLVNFRSGIRQLLAQEYPGRVRLVRGGQ